MENMKCPNCNSTEHEPNARFCHVCGRQFDSEPKENSSVRVFNVNGVEFKMIQVKGGSFMMGAHKRIENVFTNENPGRSVHLDTFWIGETEVTQELWKAVMGDNPSTFKELKRWSLGAMIHSYKSRPVETVSWKDCQDFITKLNRLTHERFRLPTEAEWEYAARGGQQSHGYNYAGSNNPDDVAWYLDNSGNVGGPYCYSEKELQKLTKNHRQTHPVKLKSCNELGLYDMSGNVWEWCQEESSPRHLYPNDPTSPIIGYDAHIIRGGSCLRQSHESLISCSSSGYNASEDIGLRLALVSNANYK
jgi:formylglycine-generating enzyme required for sulfatase activity